MTTIHTELFEAWRQLWVNRSQPYALQRADGTYRWVQRPVTDQLLRAHLAGEVTLALSSTDARGWCRWLCLDVDTPDTLLQLLALRAALAGRGLPGLVEASRRGGHLWLFLEEAMPAVEARWTVLEACEQLRTAPEYALPLPTYELYPNASVAGTLGHPVRLPLGVHRLTGTRFPLFDAQGHPCAFTTPEAALHFVLDVQRAPTQRIQRAWQRFVGGGTLPPTGDDVTPEAQLEVVVSVPAVGRVGTSSAVIRWVDGTISPLDLLAERAPETALRRVGHGYLGWCPFHDDRAPDALGRPGTPSFYVVHNRRYGWSWCCLSTNCAHSVGPMRHSFRLWQELLRLDAGAALQAAYTRWPAAGDDRDPSAKGAAPHDETLAH